jgi:hypothetical protein
LDYLLELHNNDLSYSAINLSRSTLSSFVVLVDCVGQSVGTHPLVARFMKGLFNIKPPMPRYTQIWDVRSVLNFIRTQSPINSLSLKQLTLKLTMLLALLTAQRSQSLSKLRIDKMKLSANSVVFWIDDLVKTSVPGRIGQEVKLQAYPPDRRLCIKRVLVCYLDRTATLRGTEQNLLVSFKKPHAKVSKDTVARWIRTVMAGAGIDVSKFKAHSVRAASTSAAKMRFVPITEIVARAGWTNEKTFQRFYNKPIQEDTYSDKILDMS